MLTGRNILCLGLVLDMLGAKVSKGMVGDLRLPCRILSFCLLGMLGASISLRMQRDLRVPGRILQC